MRGLGFSPFLLLTRCDGLALGALLAVTLSDPQGLARRASAYRSAFALTGLSALMVPSLFERLWPGLTPDRAAGALFTTRACLVYFGLAGFVFCTQGHPALAPLRDRRLCHIGLISYGLYLYHPLVFGAVPRLYQRFVERKLALTSTLLRDLVMLAVCFALAELSRRLLEDPIVALKERLTYRVKDRPTVATHSRHAAAGRPHHGPPEPAPDFEGTRA
jgi:peptidoglycan/LPS O-acetylase OafA/YrhL